MVDVSPDVGMLTPAFALGLGLILGLQHALEPDHIATVSALSARAEHVDKSRRTRIREGMQRFSILGAVWGAGHATTLALFSILAYVAASLIQGWIFSGLEILVGVILLILGVTVVFGKTPLEFAHKHLHRHNNGIVHSHEHEHNNGIHHHTHKSYIIGLVHGLAGSGGVIVLTAATLEGPDIVLAFTLVFGLGATIGMSLVGGLLGIPLVLAGRHKRVRLLFRYAAGVFSMVMGIIVLYTTNIGEFTSNILSLVI